MTDYQNGYTTKNAVLNELLRLSNQDQFERVMREKEDKAYDRMKLKMQEEQLAEIQAQNDALRRSLFGKNVFPDKRKCERNKRV